MSLFCFVFCLNEDCGVCPPPNTYIGIMLGGNLGLWLEMSTASRLFMQGFLSLWPLLIFSLLTILPSAPSQNIFPLVQWIIAPCRTLGVSSLFESSNWIFRLCFWWEKIATFMRVIHHLYKRVLLQRLSVSEKNYASEIKNVRMATEAGPRGVVCVLL